MVNCIQVWVGASQQTPGIVQHTDAENTELGLFPNPSLSSTLEETRLEKFTDLLKEGGTPFRTIPTIQAARWEKVVWNVAWNAITTLTDQDVSGWLDSSPEAEVYTKDLMREVIAVAGSCGVVLKHGLEDELLVRAKELTRTGVLRTSMQADREAGRKMEIEVILGTPVRKGREAGVSIPRLESLYVLLLAINKRLT